MEAVDEVPTSAIGGPAVAATNGDDVRSLGRGKGADRGVRGGLKEGLRPEEQSQ